MAPKDAPPKLQSRSDGIRKPGTAVPGGIAKSPASPSRDGTAPYATLSGSTNTVRASSERSVPSR